MHLTTKDFDKYIYKYREKTEQDMYWMKENTILD